MTALATISALTMAPQSTHRAQQKMPYGPTPCGVPQAYDEVEYGCG